MLLLALLLAAGPPLKAPAALQGKALRPYSAAISWKPPPDALGVELEARRPRGRWSRLALQPARPPEFTAHALPPGTALELRARSWNGRGSSAWTQPVTVRTLDYLEPPLALESPCVAREQLLEAALGHPPSQKPEACEARKLRSGELMAGALKLLLVDPLGDAPGCHGEGGTLTEAFAEYGGCLRHVGKLIELSHALELPKVSLPPLRSYWRLTAASGEASMVELRDGRLRVVDSGVIDSGSVRNDLPSTTDPALLVQLQGAYGAPPLDR